MMKKLMLALSLFTVVGLQAGHSSAEMSWVRLAENEAPIQIPSDIFGVVKAIQGDIRCEYNPIQLNVAEREDSYETPNKQELSAAIRLYTKDEYPADGQNIERVIKALDYLNGKDYLKQLYTVWLNKEENRENRVYVTHVPAKIIFEQMGIYLGLLKEVACIEPVTLDTQKITNYKNREAKNLSIRNIIEREGMPVTNSFGRMLLGNKNISSLDGLQDLNLNSITELYLSCNQITKIKKGAFTGLTNLESLYLDNNQLTEIKEGTFTGLINLQEVDLLGNAFVRIEGGLGNLAGVAIKIDNNWYQAYCNHKLKIQAAAALGAGYCLYKVLNK